MRYIGVYMTETRAYKYTTVDGDVFYYKDVLRTILHREDGPAIEFANGNKFWYYDSILHRLDGPAVVRIKPARHEWYIYGVQFSEEDFLIATKKIKVEDLQQASEMLHI